MKLFISLGLLACALASSTSAVEANPRPAPAASAQLSARPLATLALQNPRGLAVDHIGNLYIADLDTGKIHKLSSTGEVSEFVATSGLAIRSPIALAVLRDGTLFVADAEADALYRISAEGAITPLPNPPGDASFHSPTGVAADATGNLFVANNLGSTVLKITPSGHAAIFAGKPNTIGSLDGVGASARFHTPLSIALDPAANLYVADKDNSNIRKIAPDGTVSTLAGAIRESGRADGLGSVARFAAPRALAVDASGTVYVADTENNCIRKITTEGHVSTLAGQAGQPGYVDGVGSAARFNDPRGIAVDASGQVFVADGGNSAVRQITPDGRVTTVAAPAPPGSAPAVSGPPPLLPPRVGDSERFDYSQAQTLDGWDADPAYWSVQDGAFTAKGEKVPTSFLLTQKHFSDFRLTLRSRVLLSDNHAGVALWGERRISTRNAYSYKGPLVIFPGLGMWDYRTNKGIPVDPVGRALAREITKQNDWILVEILAQGNRMRVAYNGQQVLDWREPDPTLLKTGPIGLQLHGYTKPQEVVYCDVVIESFPKEDRLLTVKE